MRKGKSIIGKDILSLDEGIKLDQVTDLVIDPEGRRLVALVVDEGGFMSSSKVVPMEDVASFGKDAVVVASRTSVVSVADHAGLRALVERDEKILGKKVFTTSGDNHGSVADIYFDEQTGDLVGYEVSGGLIGDAAKGTSFLATDEIAVIGGDVIYVRPETAEDLERQVGGIQGAMQDAGNRIGEATNAAGEKVGQAKNAAAQKLAESRESVTQSNREAALVGKLTGSDVELDGGSVIVPKGRRIRSEDVTAAKAAGKLSALNASAAMGTAQQAGAEAKDALGAAGDSAVSLWDQFTAKIGEMTDATGKRIDHEQTKKRLSEIADAVGRPVTKVILDREDNVVLNVGDIITHAAIQRAHESGGLDSLLSSAYKGPVEFTKEEMRAPYEVEAEATVEKSTGGAVIVEELETKIEDAEKQREAAKERKKHESAADRVKRERERYARQSERDREARTRRPAATDEPKVASVTSGGPDGQDRYG